MELDLLSEDGARMAELLLFPDRTLLEADPFSTINLREVDISSPPEDLSQAVDRLLNEEISAEDFFSLALHEQSHDEERYGVLEKLLLARWMKMLKEISIKAETITERYQSNPEAIDPKSEDMQELYRLAVDFVKKLSIVTTGIGNIAYKDQNNTLRTTYLLGNDIHHDIQSWPYNVRSAIGMAKEISDGHFDEYYATEGIQKEEHLTKQRHWISSQVHQMRLSRNSIIDAQLFLLGENTEFRNMTREDFTCVIEIIARRFNLEVAVVEDESGFANTNGKLGVLIDGKALEAVLLNPSAVITAIFNELKNSLKITRALKGLESAPSLLIKITQDESSNSVRVGVKDFGIGFGHERTLSKLTEEAIARRESGSERDLSLTQRMLLNHEMRRKMSGEFTNYLLFERGKSINGGTGLGLSMAYRLALLQGGYLEAQNNIEEPGAEVCMVVPIDQMERPLPAGKEKTHRIIRFNTAATEILHPAGRTLVGKYLTGETLVEIYEPTASEILVIERELSANRAVESTQPQLAIA